MDKKGQDRKGIKKWTKNGYKINNGQKVDRPSRQKVYKNRAEKDKSTQKTENGKKLKWTKSGQKVDIKVMKLQSRQNVDKRMTKEIQSTDKIRTK